MLLSFLVPGAGQFYNGQTTKGLLHLALGVGAAGAAIYGFGTDDCAGYSYQYWDTVSESYRTRWTEGGSCGIGWAGVGASTLVRAWSLIDARSSANAINQGSSRIAVRIEPRVERAPFVLPKGSDVGALSGRLAARIRVDMALPVLEF
jgi:hypothetical protein